MRIQRKSLTHSQDFSRFLEAQKPWWVINPDSNKFSHFWQVVTNFALAFVALVTPLQVGLLEIRWDALFFITWCVDIIFMIDMILQFVTMYPKTTARGLELEFRPWKIAKHYLKTWFFLDAWASWVRLCWLVGLGDKQTRNHGWWTYMKPRSTRNRRSSVKEFFLFSGMNTRSNDFTWHGSKSLLRELEQRPKPGNSILHPLATFGKLSQLKLPNTEDFLTLIPLDTIGLLSGADRLKDLRSIKVIRVLRLLKLIRLLRSSKLTHRDLAEDLAGVGSIGCA